MDFNNTNNLNDVNQEKNTTNNTMDNFKNNTNTNDNIIVNTNHKDLMLESLSRELIEKLENIGLDITISSIPDIVGCAMEIVELRKSFHSSSKKQFVLKIIKYLSNNFLEQEQSSLVNQMIDNGIIERTIELIIAASKGKILINHVIEEIDEATEVIEKISRNCFTSCFTKKNNIKHKKHKNNKISV